ncbi:MAG TPA: leucyl aminopeptidase family protein [Solirubrobacteraceae bacterium]|jgi:leucyl aminopeptidase|nr:leucyl aminopeptidase family protein [Solirubrobacteraceae bacterium]
MVVVWRAVYVETTIAPALSTDADTVVFAVFDDQPLQADEARQPLEALLDSGEARGRFKHLALTHVDGRRVILVGLGARDELDGERARVAAALAHRRARELGAQTLCWALPPGAGDEIAEGLVQGTLLGAYRFDRYKRGGEGEAADDDGDGGAGIQRLLVSAAADIKGSVSRAVIVATAQNRARDLGNRPPNDLTPTALGSYVAELAAARPALTVSVLGGEELRRLGMGLFAAVASGSEQDPRMITLSYQGAPDSERRLALIGKAVTFDSGGLAIKSLAGMVDMKFDMAGGAAVIEALAALAELEAPINVLAVVGATENMISGTAMRAGDILTALDGTTVEMNNADAEGRLVLGDCITYARREGCDAIVDIATLTGGVVVALGSVYAGLMSNDDALAELVTACGERTGELLWRLPLHPEYAEMVKGRFAQITNRTERREASAITGAEFLHHFAGQVPWAHLDIAGVGDNGRAPYLDKGGTGFGVRLLTELALSF